MAKKYLDYDGLLYFWQKIKTLFVSDVTYNSTSKKIQKTKAGTTSDLVTLSTVATSGSYNDLSNKPTIPSATSTSPKMDGTAAVGTETAWAKGDHVHPSDTSRVPTTRTINGKALSSDVTLIGDDIILGSGSLKTIKEGFETLGGAVEDLVEEIPGLLDGKVDKETGKGLSTNDYTTAEKNKLSGIAAGAEVNVQSDWNQTTTTADDYIKNKPTISGQVFYGTLGEYEQTATSTRTYSIAANNFKLKTGNIILFYWAKEVATASVSINLNVNGTGSLALKAPKGSATITYNELNDNSRVYAAVYTGVDYKLLGYFDKDTTYPYGTASQIETGTNMADRVWSAKILSDYVTGKVGSIPVATTSANGLMSSTDKSKLNGIASGAEVNVQSDWNQTTTTADDFIKNKPTLGAAAAKGVITSISSDSTDLPTVTAVKGYVDTAITGATAYQGIAPTTFAPTNYKAGWYWVIGTAGTYCGQVCEAGDMIFCKTAASTYAAANFDVVQTNLDITSITNAEIDTILAA